MAYTYTVADKGKDPTNGNIVVTVNFDDGSGIIHSQKTWAFDLTNDRIDAWARDYITVLETRDASFDAITTGVPTTPKPIGDNIVALRQAEADFAAAREKASVAKLNDPDAEATYAALLAARAALDNELTALAR